MFCACSLSMSSVWVWFTYVCAQIVTDVGSSPSEQALNVSQSAVVQGVPSPNLDSRNVWTKPIWEAPNTKKMPKLETFRLTKELVQQRVKDNVVIVTFGNYAFMDFILTWVKHLTDLGISNLLVGKLPYYKLCRFFLFFWCFEFLYMSLYHFLLQKKCACSFQAYWGCLNLNELGAMDTKLLEALYWKGVPVFDMGSHMSTIDVGWGSPTFHKMGREKVILIDSILPYGFELLMCDTDMVWLKVLLFLSFNSKSFGSFYWN